MATRLQCPECRMELLPATPGSAERHVTCGRCGREIFLESEKYVRVECPRCEEAGESESEKAAAECCCP